MYMYLMYLKAQVASIPVQIGSVGAQIIIVIVIIIVIAIVLPIGVYSLTLVEFI